MPSNDEIIRLLLQIQDNIAEAVGNLGTLTKAAKDTTAAYEVLDTKTGTYAISTTAVTTALDAEIAAMVEATQAQKVMSQVLDEKAIASTKNMEEAAREAAEALGSGTGKGGKVGFGRAALQAQYAMDDFAAVYKDGGFSRALASMQNNIPQIALALGATGGMTAAVGGLAIALGLATPYVKAFWDEWSGHPEDEVKKMEELEKKMDEFSKKAKKPTTAEAKGQKALEAAFTEGGYEKIMKGFAETLAVSDRPDRAQMTAEEKREFESAQALAKPLLGVASQAQLKRSKATIDRINAAVGQRNVDRAKQLMIDATEGKGAVGAGAKATLGALVEQNVGAFPAGLLGDIEGADPADITRQQKLEAQGHLNVENMARHDKEKKVAEAAAKDKAKERQQAAKDRIANRAKVLKDKVDAADQEDRDKDDDARLAAQVAADKLRDEDKARSERQQIARADRAAAAKAQRQAHAQQVHGARGQERELNQRDDDIVQGRAEIRENMIQSARDRGESHQEIAAMLVMSRQAAHADAAAREFWRRERAKYVESVTGGGNQ